MLNPSYAARPAFSLLELVIVVVIIGLIASIVVPRMSGASQRSRAAAYIANTNTLQKAVDMYAAEHEGRTPAEDEFGNLNTSPDGFIKRLTTATDSTGSNGGSLGPYLRDLPRNPGNGLSDVRIGENPGTNTTGWVYVPSKQIIVPDDPVGWAIVKDQATSGGTVPKSGQAVGVPAELGSQANEPEPTK